MDNDNKGGGLPGSGLVTLALLAVGAVFLVAKPLESSRPGQPAAWAERRAAPQDVDARLWQDPLGAVAKSRATVLKTVDDRRRDEVQHSLTNFAKSLHEQARAGGKGGALVLAVMLSGGPYAEQAEGRLRTRHAVLAGLSSHGFVPVDNEHLGYVYLRPGDAPVVAAFERFEYSLEGKGTPDPASPRRSADEFRGARVSVLWLDSSDYYDAPLARLGDLMAKLAPSPSQQDIAPVRWRLLGPSSSDGLRAMVLEAAEPGFDGAALAPHDLRIFSGAATAADAALLRRPSNATGNRLALPAESELADTKLGAWFAKRGVHLVRSIGSDDALGRALVAELQLRGLDALSDVINARLFRARGSQVDEAALRAADKPCDKSSPRRPSDVAIVSEMDTLYGRSLRNQFRADPATAHDGFCVTRWQYVRGLDGRLPGDTPPSPDRSRKDGKPDAADAPLVEGSYTERPEGQSQLDYLRRLAQRLREEDAALRARDGRRGGIRAVGVLGNDVYDKLLILQALQPALPHALFFTTDLDARLFHPREQEWARNLIVASSFTLRLDDSLQRNYAPFRDSYQTSAFFATQMAVADFGHRVNEARFALADGTRVQALLSQPRILEVSRSGFFDFAEVADENDANCRPWWIGRCERIHPGGSPRRPGLGPGALFLLGSALVTALWLPALVISRGARRRLRRWLAAPGPDTSARWRRGLMLGGAGALLCALPGLLTMELAQGVAEWMTRGGKPLTFTDGISPWPTHFIRLGTLVLSLYMVARAWSALRSNLQTIAREFRLGATRRHFQDEVQIEQRKRGRRDRLAAMLTLRFYRERPGVLRPVLTMTPAAVAFWKHYLLQSTPQARLLRTTACVIAMTLVGGLITLALPDAPTSPQRGELTRHLQGLITVPASIAAQFLIFFVADASLLCVFFIRGLRMHHANWPERTLRSFQAASGVPAQHLDDWIDLQFVARRTAVIGRLIYYPFVVLSLMVAARSSFFDDWYAPMGLYLMAVISFGVVLASALSLRMAAEASREQALLRLRDALLRARGQGDAALASQLQLLIERVTALNEGAFAPYSRQPLLKALLLPLLTYGGSSLFDYLTLVNL